MITKTYLCGVNEIKTYSSVHRKNDHLRFGISRMEEIYDRHEGKPDVPHRHDYFTIVLVINGEGEHVIDFHTHVLSSHQAYFISPGQVHQIIENRRSVGYAIVFNASFLAANNIPLSFIEDVHLFQAESAAPAMALKNEAEETLQGYCEQMLTWYASDQQLKEQALGSLLKLFLISSNSYCTLPLDSNEELEAGRTILKRFKAMVNANHAKWHSTSDYAKSLNISPDHLNRTIKSLIGKTAKETIQDRIIIAAKRLLYFTELSTKEIGFQLGFEEPSHFSAFFKKCTGQSPTEFKKST
ncbi:MAG: AraC family transcriptional activator of pobA [Flavobacteriales bacterium]